MDYMENTEAVIQNLKDAGCDNEMVTCFLKMTECGERQGQLKLLEKQRRNLLEQVHKNEKQIDCLDYLVFQMKNKIKTESRGK